jgi:hypothetical protein
MFLAAIAALEASVGADGVQVAMPQRDLSELLLEMKRPEEALVHSTRAYAIWHAKGSEERTTALIELSQGMMLWAGGGDRREAIRLVRSARDHLLAIGAPGKVSLPEAQAWLRSHRS